MNGTFTGEAPQQTALCRVCFEGIPKGGEAVCFTTCAGNKYLRLFIHPHCFPEKATLIQ